MRDRVALLALVSGVGGSLVLAAVGLNFPAVAAVWVGLVGWVMGDDR